MSAHEGIRYRRQLFLCAGKTCVLKYDPEATKKAVKQAIKDAGLSAEVRCCTCSCLDYCEEGPNAVLYPEGKLLKDVKPEDWPAIVAELLKR